MYQLMQKRQNIHHNWQFNGAFIDGPLTSLPFSFNTSPPIPCLWAHTYWSVAHTEDNTLTSSTSLTPCLCNKNQLWPDMQKLRTNGLNDHISGEMISSNPICILTWLRRICFNNMFILVYVTHHVLFCSLSCVSWQVLKAGTVSGSVSYTNLHHHTPIHITLLIKSSTLIPMRKAVQFRFAGGTPSFWNFFALHL